MHTLVNENIPQAFLDAEADKLIDGERTRRHRLHQVSVMIIATRVMRDPSIVDSNGDTSFDPIFRERIARSEGISWRLNNTNKRLIEEYIDGDNWDGIHRSSFKMAIDGSGEPWWELITGNIINVDGKDVQETIRMAVLNFLNPRNFDPLSL